MANLIRAETLVEDDPWQRVEGAAEPAALPAGAVLVPLGTWLEHRVALLTRGTPVGVWLATDEAAESLEGRLDGLGLIAIHFPVFSDGRGYSNARILRERLGWRGELRAIGDVLRDQLFAMRRCGFDAFEIRADRSAADALASLRDFRNVYQHATRDPSVPLIERR
jgi:uncharacterized protein (DUF934 family)